MANHIHLLLFDVDGTLLLSGGAGARALEESFEELFGLPGAMEGIRPHGKTDILICREMFFNQFGHDGDMEEYRILLDRYLDILPRTVREADSYRIMPGIPALLELISERDNVYVGLGTGNIELGARIKLERAGLNRFFPFGGFGCDAAERVGLLEIGFQRGESRIFLREGNFEITRWVIGDTWRDVEAGRSCGARTVAVATGGDSWKRLSDTNPDYLYYDFADPAPFLSLLGG